MSYRKRFQKVIEKEFPEYSNVILDETDKGYYDISPDTAFARTSGNPLDRRLDFTAYFLSFIKTLEKRELDYEKIKSICMDVTYEYVKPKNRVHAWMKRLPPKLTNTWLSQVLLKKMDNKIRDKGHKDGFSARLIRDKDETYGLGYGIDILECGICKLFARHKAEKYTTILCEVDKITSGLAGLELVRKSTIAYGAEKCDFRFRKPDH